MLKPYVMCIDVGSYKNIGWADSERRYGSGEDLGDALDWVGKRLWKGELVALGFEAPIWTPRRMDLKRITGSRGGVESTFNRAWSAGAGCGALGAALVLMPWCFSRIAQTSPLSKATTLPERFAAMGQGLLVWEAFVSGAAKGVSHHNDAELAVAAFERHYPNLTSDIPPEPATNHAAVALNVAGFSVASDELGMAGIVVAVLARELAP